MKELPPIEFGMRRKARRGKKAEDGTGTFNRKTQNAAGQWVLSWQVRATPPSGVAKRFSGTTTAPAGLDLPAAESLARDDIAKKKAAIEEGKIGNSGEMTMGQLMADYLAYKKVAGDVGPKTLLNNAQVARLHIIPRIGKIKVRDLTAAQLLNLQTELLQKNLGNNRKRAHQLIIKALDHAVILGVIPNHPARSVPVPKLPPPKRKRVERAGGVFAWTAEQAEKLYSAAIQDGTVLSWAIAFALKTGLRRGEVFGLRWKDVDLSHSADAPFGAVMLRVQVVENEQQKKELGELKTDGSRRDLTLVPAAAAVLQAVKDWQTAQQAKKGEAWNNPLGLVFTTRKGEIQHLDNVGRKLTKLTAHLGIPRFNFHVTRHTFASLAWLAGYTMEQISGYLGHDSTSTTEEIYRHHFTRLRPAIHLPSSKPVYTMAVMPTFSAEERWELTPEKIEAARNWFRGGE